MSDRGGESHGRHKLNQLQTITGLWRIGDELTNKTVSIASFLF